MKLCLKTHIMSYRILTWCENLLLTRSIYAEICNLQNVSIHFRASFGEQWNIGAACKFEATNRQIQIVYRTIFEVWIIQQIEIDDSFASLICTRAKLCYIERASHLLGFYKIFMKVKSTSATFDVEIGHFSGNRPLSANSISSKSANLLKFCCKFDKFWNAILLEAGRNIDHIDLFIIALIFLFFPTGGLFQHWGGLSWRWPMYTQSLWSLLKSF